MAAKTRRLYRDLEREVAKYPDLLHWARVADRGDQGNWMFWDTQVAGLRLIVGKRTFAFSFFKQSRVHGKRQTTSITLGHLESGMTVKAARAAALVHAGRIAAGRIAPGKRSAVKFDAAFDDYCSFLEAKAKRKGKPARWAYNVRQLGKSILLPEFGRWPLADLSHSPAIIRDWHKTATKQNGPVHANRAAQVLRATYRYAAKLNRNLPPALPTSGIIWNAEEPAEKGVGDFAKWAAAWRAIPMAARRGYTLAMLLTGCRRSELASLQWCDIDARSRTLLLRNVKSRSEKRRDVRLPLSLPIVRAFKLAKGVDAVKVFPGCFHNPGRDALPAHGHALRHAYESIMVELRIDPLMRKILMGHTIGGDDVTEGYASQKMLGSMLRREQARVSAEIMRRLEG